MRYYKLYDIEFTRPAFEDLLIQVILSKQLFNLVGLVGASAEELPKNIPMWVERNVKHHPLRLGRELYGAVVVVTYTR